jgi:transposase
MRMLSVMTKAAEWAQRVTAWRASGKSAQEFCRGREYRGKDLQWWSSHLRRRGQALPAGRAAVRLARVIRKASSPPTAMSSIVLELGDARVLLGADVDRATLTTVLEALRAANSGGAR